MKQERRIAGRVASPLRKLADAPRQADEGAPVHPRGDISRPPEGVFSTRAPHRPNPVGLHYAKVPSVDGMRIRTAALAADVARR